MYLSMGVNLFSGSLFQDNCEWIDFMYGLTTIETRITKNIARCNLNLRDYIDRAKDWTDLITNGFNSDFIPILFDKNRPNQKPLCEFDEVEGRSVDRIDSLSFSLLELVVPYINKKIPTGLRALTNILVPSSKVMSSYCLHW